MQCLWEFDPTNGRGEHRRMKDMLTKNLAFLLKGDKDAQQVLADQIGITQPTVSKWSNFYEKGSTSEPEFRKIARLARHFGVSLDDLYSRDLEVEGRSGLSQPERLDSERMATVVGTIDAFLARTGFRPSALAKAAAVCDMYAAMSAGQESDEESSAMIAVILQSLGVVKT